MTDSPPAQPQKPRGANKTPPIGVSAATVQEHQALLSEWAGHPEFERIASRYKIQSNGKTFRVMKRGWFGIWEQTKSSICLSSMRGGYCDGVSQDDAYCAMVEKIVEDLQELAIHPYRDC